MRISELSYDGLNITIRHHRAYGKPFGLRAHAKIIRHNDTKCMAIPDRTRNNLTRQFLCTQVSIRP